MEFLSALHRRYRNKELNEHTLAEAIRGFDEEYSHFHVEPLGSAIVHEAEALVKDYGKTHGLRTLDALHLATFVLVKEDDWFFVACDDNLINAAKAIGALVFNPVKRT
ncbi:MAG: type II toxin-antitoxin system VapC family toxin [Bacillota bacterium]